MPRRNVLGEPSAVLVLRLWRTELLAVGVRHPRKMSASKNVGGGSVNSSARRAGIIRKGAQKTNAVEAAGSKDILWEDSALRAARACGTCLVKSVAEFTQVPRAPVADAPEGEKTTGVSAERQELAMVGSGHRVEKNFDEVL